METTTEYLASLLETTTGTFSTTYPQLRSAADILSDAGSTGSRGSRGSVEHQDAHQITFEIPSHSDLERIQHLDTFNNLMRRLGNTVYNTGSERAAAASADGLPITSEQIARSAVLDLADLKSGGASGWERFFQGADVHSLINYLWIGVVSALVVLSLVFILFSCHFYRKFREWKKCNKDIRAHMNDGLYQGGNMAPCDTLLPHHHHAGDSAYFQKESPPCYTIATGLPTYDEALHHQRFSFGMRFVCPTLAAVHQQPAISGSAAANCEKHDFSIRRADAKQQQPQAVQLSACRPAAVTAAPPMYAAPPAYRATLQPDAFEACGAAAPTCSDLSAERTECVFVDLSQSRQDERGAAESLAGDTCSAPHHQRHPHHHHHHHDRFDKTNTDNRSVENAVAAVIVA